jgi:Flp pilus assembly pilin Flp
MKDFLRRLWREQQGQDLTEYALLLVLLALAAIATMGQLAGVIQQVFEDAAGILGGAAGGATP